MFVSFWFLVLKGLLLVHDRVEVAIKKEKRGRRQPSAGCGGPTADVAEWKAEWKAKVVAEWKANKRKLSSTAPWDGPRGRLSLAGRRQTDSARKGEERGGEGIS